MPAKIYQTVEQIPDQFEFIADSQDVTAELDKLGLGAYASDYGGLFILRDHLNNTIDCYAIKGTVPYISKAVQLLARNGRNVQRLPLIVYEEQTTYLFPPEYAEVRYINCTKYVHVTSQDKALCSHNYHLLIRCGWYVWAECPGCLPDSDSALGPFPTLSEARDEWNQYSC